MTGPWIYAGAILTLSVGIVATIWIGQSRENQTENPAYGQRMTRNWRRLAWLYLFGIVGFLSVLLWLMK
jgi:hypothetical protein